MNSAHCDIANPYVDRSHYGHNSGIRIQRRVVHPVSLATLIETFPYR